MCKKDLVVIGFYVILAGLVFLGGIFEPKNSDAILACTIIYILSVIPAMLIVKGYVK